MNGALSNLRLHCSMLQKNLRCETPHETHILGFGVPNAKNLAYGIPATNALRIYQPNWIFYKDIYTVCNRIAVCCVC